MKDNIQEILYKKTKQDLTFKDKRYINSLIKIPKIKKQYALCCFLVNAIFTIPLMFAIFWFKDISAAMFLSVFASAAFAATVPQVIRNINDSYKDLGITKNEFKQLKKSGRLKDLSKMIEDLNKEDLHTLNKLSQDLAEFENKKEFYDNSIKEKFEEKKSLIARMIKSKQITEEEGKDLLTFKTKQVNNNLKDQENEYNFDIGM